jgi:hypothetical protein
VTADPLASGEEPRRGPRGARGRRVAALIALVLGLAGFVISATGMATQLLPRRFSAAQQEQIKEWEIAGRWQQKTAGQIFPASVGYQLSANLLQDVSPLNLRARRVAIAPQSGCGKSVITSAAATVLRRYGCKAVLRATYVDSTWSYVMTVGVAVLPGPAAAKKAGQALSQTQLAVADQPGADRLPAGILVVRYHGAAAAMYDYSRQISASFSAGPYVVMYAVGYADRRPRVKVTSDHYSYSEMTSLAGGVAQSVAATLATPPATPRCPGTAGC